MTREADAVNQAGEDGEARAPGEGPARPRRRGLAARALRAAALAAPWAYALLLAAPRRTYVLDLASHFGPQVAAGLGVVAGLFLLARCRRVALSAALAGAATLGLAAREWNVPGGGESSPGGRIIRLAHYNAKGDTSVEFTAWLRATDADLVCLVEIPSGFAAANPWVAERYPYRVEARPGLMWQMALYSKFPFERARMVHGESERVNWASFLARRSVVVRPDERTEFLFGGTHPASPRTPSSWRSSLGQVRGDGEIVSGWLRERPMAALISGDFNSTPSGMVHRAFRGASGLTGWAALYGGGTWHARAGRWLGIPIDAVFTGGGARAVSVRIGPRFRSDHLPAIWTIEIPGRQGGGPSGGAGAGGAGGG